MEIHQSLRCTFASVCFCALILLGGCGSKGPKTIKVEGVISYRNKPVEKVEVQFTPVGDTGGPLRRIASAEIVTEGRYSLGTFAKGDGALPGEYAVTVTRLKRKSSIDGDESSTKAGSAPVPAAYARQESTPLKAVIPADAVGTLQFDFELKD